MPNSAKIKLCGLWDLGRFVRLNKGNRKQEFTDEAPAHKTQDFRIRSRAAELDPIPFSSRFELINQHCVGRDIFASCILLLVGRRTKALSLSFDRPVMDGGNVFRD